MASTYLVNRWGGSEDNPTVEKMLSALSELDVHDPEHPDCWLSDGSGWTIAAHEGGLLVLENVESGEGPWHLANAPRTLVLQLWQALQRGELNEIQKQDWKDGYGY